MMDANTIIIRILELPSGRSQKDFQLRVCFHISCKKLVSAPLDVSQVNLPESQKPKQEETEMEKAMKATLESLPIAKREAVCSISFFNPQIFSVTKMMSNQKRRGKMKFSVIFFVKNITMVRFLVYFNPFIGKVTATCSWEQAVKWLQQDPRFRIIPKVSEKKQIFNGWKVQKQKEERVRAKFYLKN